MSNIKYYSFFYCMLHDDGWIIEGIHKSIPCNYTIIHANNCEPCDWCNMGIISYNGDSVDVLKTVRINYDIYNGNFLFCQYINCITDAYGNCIKLDEHSFLYKWIDILSFNNTNEFLDMLT